MNVHLFVKTDSPCYSNWVLRKTALDNQQQFNENVVNAVLKRFYMDDYLDSFDDPQTTGKTIIDVVALSKLDGFDLAKFSSNSRDILKEISPGNLSPKYEELLRDLIDQWNLWKKSVLKLSSLAVQRWINFKSTETEKTEFHIFADASSKVYGAAAYVNLRNTNSKSCNLVQGKSKIASMRNKLVTISRLELQAVLLASRIKLTVTQEMEIHIDNIYLWSDSKTVLNYLRNRNTNFGPYIMRRCNEIRQNTNVEDWNYIPTDLNIADVLSRGILLENPDVLSSWFTGPNFMKEASSIYNFESTENERNTIETATANPYQKLNVYTSEVKSAVTNTSRTTIFWEYYYRGIK